MSELKLPEFELCQGFKNFMAGHMPGHGAFKFHWYVYNFKGKPIPMSTPRALDKCRRALDKGGLAQIYPAPSLEELGKALMYKGINMTVQFHGIKIMGLMNTVAHGSIRITTKVGAHLEVLCYEDGPNSYVYRVEKHYQGKTTNLCQIQTSQYPYPIPMFDTLLECALMYVECLER